jgi:HK97 family phage prohead protease
VFSTGAPSRRFGYVETLRISTQSVDLSRLSAGAVPLLDSHQTDSADAVIGKVIEARIERGALVGKIQFAETPRAQAVEGMVARGELNSLSIGYSIDDYEETGRDDSGRAGILVTRLTLMEVSFVAIPADAGAQVRSLKIHGAYMTERSLSQTDAGEIDGDDFEDGETEFAPIAEARAPTREETIRVREIKAIAERSGLGADFYEPHVRAGTALPAYRSLVLDRIHQHEPARYIRSSAVGIIDPGVSPQSTLNAMAEGLICRALDFVPDGRNGLPKISDPRRAAEFANYSLVDLGLKLTGNERRMKAGAAYDFVQTRAQMGTTDFPNLLSIAANKILLAQYEYQKPSYRALARKRNFNDFKVHSFLRAGDFPILEALLETGEFRNGSLSENRETVTAATYGKIVSFTRQMMINDDLSAFTDVTAAAGRRVADFENSLAWKIILANSGAGPVLSDTGNLFNATAIATAGGHANLAAAASGINITSVDLGRQALRGQKSLDGIPLNSAPSLLVVGPQKQTEAEQLLSTSLLATQISNVVPGGIQTLGLAVDAYIADKSWYLFADPNACPVFTWGYVDGFEGPRFAIDQPFRQDGIQFKVAEEFGFGAIDFRGGYRNAGG